MEREKRTLSISMFAAVVPVIFITISTLAFVFATVSSSNEKMQRLENRIEILSETISLQDAYVSVITEQISESPQSVDANINKIVEKLDSNYKKLQEIIIGNPANIIEFALLIQEVDNLKESYKDHKESVYEELARSFGIFQWFIYINIFIALAVLTIAVSIYYQSRSIQRTKDKGAS